jgi:hypothetical protein
MVESVSDYLTEKLTEYRIMSAPLERAAQEMDYAHSLLRARVETEIAEHVPLIGTLAEILDISILDLLFAPDRPAFVQNAMSEAGLTSEDIMLQLRALGPPHGDELKAIGLEERS